MPRSVDVSELPPVTASEEGTDLASLMEECDQPEAVRATARRAAKEYPDLFLDESDARELWGEMADAWHNDYGSAYERAESHHCIGYLAREYEPEDVIQEREAVLIAAAYAETQDFLRQEGISSVTLHRGIGWYDPEDVPQWAWSGEGEATAQTMDTAESWTVDQRMAKEYACMGSDGEWNEHAVMLTATVPAERIVSLPGVGGLGDPTQGEVIVLGGEYGTPMNVNMLPA